MSQQNKSQNLPAKKPVDMLQEIINSQTVQEQFRNALGESKNLFIASLISVYSSTPELQKCYPSEVVKEALKAAVLKLPIEPSLGFAYIVTFRNNKRSEEDKREVREPTMLIGYKGQIQLAQRSGQIKTINYGPVYEGETVVTDRISGNVSISGKPKSEKETGYFAYFKLTNGYEKSDYWTKEKVIKHAKKYSAGYQKGKAWRDNFTEMAGKTVLSAILSKYAPKSVDFILSNAVDDYQMDSAESSQDINIDGDDPKAEETPTNGEQKQEKEKQQPTSGEQQKPDDQGDDY